MSAWRFVLVLAAGLCCSTPASAILFKMKEVRNAPILAGFLVEDQKTVLRIRVRTTDGKDEIRPFLAAKIEIIYQLDVKLLEGLSKDNPKGYHDFAEVLARDWETHKKEDPEAVETAMRLYLIAAKLAPEKFGSSSLLAMSKLVPPAEARKYRGLAFILDPKLGAEVLKAEVSKPVAPGKLPARPLTDFIEALQHFRAGRIKAATDSANKDGVDKIFSAAPDKIDKNTFMQWCADANCANCRDGRVSCSTCQGKGAVLGMFGNFETCTTCKGVGRMRCPDCDGTRVREPLPDQAMRTALRHELWALDQQAGVEDTGRKEAAEPKGWSTLLQSGRQNPVFRLSLETVSDFDLSKTRYRNLMWVKE